MPSTHSTLPLPSDRVLIVMIKNDDVHVIIVEDEDTEMTTITKKIPLWPLQRYLALDVYNNVLL